MTHSGADGFQAGARLLKALGHPVRLALLAELVRGAKCVTDMRDLLEVKQPNVSQHLTVLRQAELVDCHEEGNLHCYYILRPALVRAVLRLVACDDPSEPQSAARPSAELANRMPASTGTQGVR